MGGLIESIPPDDEPISLAELRLAGDVDETALDPHLEILRFAAREYYERVTGWRLMRTTYVWTERSFLHAIAKQQGQSDRFDSGSHGPHHSHLPFHSFGFHHAGDHSQRLIELPKPPLDDVSQVQYFDVTGASQVFDAADFSVDNTTKIGAFFLNNGSEWPQVERRERAGISVTFTAGFADAEVVPRHHKMAILSLALHWMENREAVVIGERVVVREVPLEFKSLVNLSKVVRV